MDCMDRSVSCAITDLRDVRDEVDRRSAALRGGVDRLFDQLLEAVQARRNSVLAQLNCIEQQLKTEIIQEETALFRAADAYQTSEVTSDRRISDQVAHTKTVVRNVKQMTNLLDFRADVSELCADLLSFGEVSGCPTAAESKVGKCACSTRSRRGVASCSPSSCATRSCNEKAALVSSYFEQDSGPVSCTPVSTVKTSETTVKEQTFVSDTDETLQTMRRIRESPLIFWMPISVTPQTQRDPRIDDNLIVFKRLRATPLSSWLPNAHDEERPVELSSSVPNSSECPAVTELGYGMEKMQCTTPESERSLSVSSESTDSEFEEVIDSPTLS